MAQVWLDPDQMAAAAAHITRQWGFGYTVAEIETPSRYVSVFELLFGDGARPRIAVDKWGNVRDLPEGNQQGEREIIRAMVENAKVR